MQEAEERLNEECGARDALVSRAEAAEQRCRELQAAVDAAVQPGFADDSAA